jgi:hypothetical protein
MDNLSSLTLKPSRLRHVWTRCLEAAIPYLTAIFGRMLVDYLGGALTFSPEQIIKEVPFHLAVIVILAIFFGVFDVEKYQITVAEGQIEGPSEKHTDQRVRFPVVQVDRTRVDRSLFQKIMGQRIIYSCDDEKLLVNEAVFSPEQTRQLLQSLNYL